MDVERTQPGCGKRPWREQQPVGCDHQDLGARGLDARQNLVGFQAVRLEDRKPALERELLHRAGRSTQAAPGRTVRLGQYQRDFVPGVEQRSQRACCEVGRTCED